MGTATTFADLIANPESEKVFLAETQVARRAENLSLAEGQTNTWEWPRRAILNGGFEIAGAGGADVFESWIEGVTGTGVVAEGAAYSGAHSCSLGSGAASGDALIGMTMVLTENKYYKLTFYYKKSAALPFANIYFYLHSPDSFYDFVTKSWGTGVSEYVIGDSTEWIKETLILRSHPTRSTNYVFGFHLYGATSGANQTILIDEVSLVEIDVAVLADGSIEEIQKTVDEVEINGVAMTSRADIASTEANAGSFYWDDINKILYVHCVDSGNPSNDVVIAFFWLCFATRGIILDSRYYEPYIAGNGIPSISKRISEIHYGTKEMGGGTVVLLNGRGYFDQIAKSFIWTNKTIKLLVGGDLLAYAEYSTIFTGKIIQTNFTNEEFSLSVRSSSYDLLRDLPLNDFWTSGYPNMDPSVEGFPIPYYWGVYDEDQAPLVVCIDTAWDTNEYQFKICDTTHHAIKSITQVYIDYGDGAGWQTIAHGDEDLNAATFTILSTDFVLGITRVKVAFEGYHSGGVLIEGAPEVVEDILLNQCGYAAGDLNVASFTASKAESTCTLNVFVANFRTAISVIEQICASDIAYFDDDGAGLLRYRTFTPAVSTSALPVIDATDILEIPTIWEDYNQLYYRVKVGYSYLCSRETYLYKDETDYDSLYKYGKREVLSIQSYLRTATQASDLAVKISMLVKDVVSQIRVRLKASLIDKEIGDQIKITLERATHANPGGYAERIFEIKEKNLSCFPLTLDLVCRDSMDFFLDVGIWMADTAPDWSAATSQERDESGFWADSSGFCDPADYSSLNKSRWW